jgi:hypothetical protein
MRRRDLIDQEEVLQLDKLDFDFFAFRIGCLDELEPGIKDVVRKHQ